MGFLVFALYPRGSAPWPVQEPDCEDLPGRQSRDPAAVLVFVGGSQDDASSTGQSKGEIAHTQRRGEKIGNLDAKTANTKLMISELGVGGEGRGVCGY